jgi:hypothetical protein
MSIYGIRGPSNGIRPGAPLPQRPDAPGTQGTGNAQRAIAPAAPSRTTGIAPASQSVPSQPPAGTDPELWSVLTNDERTYFAKLGAMGPLTYGRVLSGHLQPTTPHVRGGRLDVKA